MKAKIILVLVFITAAVMLTACVNPFLPIYEMTDEDGTSVYIDGVRYKELPLIKWTLFPNIWRMIGYAGDRHSTLFEAERDTEKNFIFIKGTFTDYYDGFLYRADKTIPEPSAEVIDKILWYDYLSGNSDKAYTNITEDKDTIKELFKILNTETITTEFNTVKKDSKGIAMAITCYSKDLPGAAYILDIGISNGKIICGDINENKYVEMPTDLLEKIAGKPIDVNEFTEGY